MRQKRINIKNTCNMPDTALSYVKILSENLSGWCRITFCCPVQLRRTWDQGQDTRVGIRKAGLTGQDPKGRI